MDTQQAVIHETAHLKRHRFAKRFESVSFEQAGGVEGAQAEGRTVLPERVAR